MAATMWIELESGTDSAPVHPHNGYWAGDFGSTVSEEPGDALSTSPMGGDRRQGL